MRLGSEQALGAARSTPPSGVPVRWRVAVAAARARRAPVPGIARGAPEGVGVWPTCPVQRVAWQLEASPPPFATNSAVGGVAI